MILTVIIRNISPLIFMQEPVLHRTVHIELTPEQEKLLALRITGKNNGEDVVEDISSCFIEPNPHVEGKEGA